MAVKASVSISEQQEKFARRLVAEGRYASLSAVVQKGLELLREEAEQKEADLVALRALIAEREADEFLDLEQSDRQIEKMIAAKKASYGL
ncbi:type II toxin-antitoxin system ParD family antitoxin [Rhizobium sp. TRM95796]|uniref:type II toxin-antitoxin system ParD family antitoxin n=1 Tax=Rhizobium sp. TRM95796 TaxID=2979862 RepID=UPI0021E7B48C|nr:type II toxin-antitoxin system ParD family antitoxin [Rhizobium sp. TRM95796]MCV3767036.1 type II toxin-antitoxin system ParD family antitoxin [Rhizobium sp. TRM95796]